MTSRPAPTPATKPASGKEPRPAGHPLALLALLGGATGIGFAPILVRLADTGPSATAFYRLLFALPLLWVWAGWHLRRHPDSPRPRSAGDFALLGACGLLFTADLSIWHWSLRYTTVANSTLLTNIAPVFVTLGAWVFLRERVTARFALGLALALGGCALLLGSSVRLGREHLRGDALALFAALFYGGYLLVVKLLRRRFPTPILMAWAGLASCPAFGAVAVVTGDNLIPGSATSWMALASLALVSHVGGQTLITYGFGHLPASFSSVSLLWQPVVAAGTAWLFLAEPIGWLQAAGGTIVLAGILVTSRSLAPTGEVTGSARGPSQTAGAAPNRVRL